MHCVMEDKPFVDVLCATLPEIHTVDASFKASRKDTSYDDSCPKAVFCIGRPLVFCSVETQNTRALKHNVCNNIIDRPNNLISNNNDKDNEMTQKLVTWFGAISPTIGGIDMFEKLCVMSSGNIFYYIKNLTITMNTSHLNFYLKRLTLKNKLGKSTQ